MNLVTDISQTKEQFEFTTLCKIWNQVNDAGKVIRQYPHKLAGTQFKQSGFSILQLIANPDIIAVVFVKKRQEAGTENKRECKI